LRSVWVFALLGVALALCAALLLRTPVSGDLSAFLPRSPSPAQQLLVDQLREGVVSRLVLVALEGESEGTGSTQLAQLSETMRGRLAADPHFVSVNNGARGPLEAEGQLLFERRYLLSPAVTPARFTRDGLHAALERNLELLASPVSMLASEWIAADPTGEMLELMDLLDAGDGPQKRHGVWFSRDGSRALMILQTQAEGYDLEAQAAAVQSIRWAFAHARAQAGMPARLLLSGPGVFAVSARHAIKHDALRLSLIASMLASALLLYAFRSLWIVVLTLIPVTCGALAGAAAVSLGFGAIHGVTLGFGMTLMGEAVDYAVYLFTHIDARNSAASALRRLWPALVVGMLTSVFGYGAMLFSGFPGLAQLGLFSIVGVMAALLVTRVVLPRLVPDDLAVLELAHLAAPMRCMMSPLQRLRLPAAALVVFGLAWLVSQGGARWDDDLSSLSPIAQADKALDQALRADLGAPDVRHVLIVSGTSAQGALEAAETMGEALEPLRAQGHIAGFDSPARYLPSMSAQRARQAAIPDAPTLEQRMNEAAEGLPYRSEIFKPFLAAASAARVSALLERADLERSAYALKLDSLLLERRGTWYAILPLRGVADVSPVSYAAQRTGLPGAVLLDVKQEADALYRGYRDRALLFALIGAAAMFVLLWGALRSLRRAFDVALPIVGAIVTACLVLAVAEVRLTLFHLVALLLVAGVGSNYALLLERRALLAGDSVRSLAAVVLCSGSTVIAFGLLALSSTPVLSAIGSTVALGAVLIVVFALMFGPRPDELVMFRKH